MSANTKKVNLEEIKIENLKKAIKDIDTVSDVYQRTHLRLLLVQTINGMNTTSTPLPEGRESLDNTTPKTDNKTAETVAKAKEALDNVLKETPESVIAETEAVIEEVVEPEVQVQEATEEVVVEETVEYAQVDELGFDPGDGNLVDIAPQYNALQIPDDENKQIIAYYLAVYDGESVEAITSAFSSNIESNPYALLNADNYEAYLAYFNECLQG